MDAALASFMEKKMGKEISFMQWNQLVATACALKEKVLTHPSPKRESIWIHGEGSQLLAGGTTLEVEGEEVKQCLWRVFLVFALE